MSPENQEHAVIYCGGEWCPHCRRVKQWLGSHSIDFEEVTVEQGEGGRPVREEMVERTGYMSIPTLIIDDEAYNNPQNEELEEILL